MSKQLKLALGAGVLATAAVLASAASLGTVTSTNLGAGNTVVASCDTDGIAVDYTTVYDATTATYRVSEVKLSRVAAACNGQDVNITVYGGAAGDASRPTIGTVTAPAAVFLGTADLRTITLPVVGTGTPVALPRAQDVTGVAIVISGAVA